MSFFILVKVASVPKKKNYILPKLAKFIILQEKEEGKKELEFVILKQNNTNLGLLSLDILHLFHEVFNLLCSIIHIHLFELFKK